MDISLSTNLVFSGGHCVRVAVRADIGSMSVWLPLLSAGNLQSLTAMFFASFLARLIYIARYVLGSLKC